MSTTGLHRCPSKRESGGDFRQKRRKQCELGGRERSDGITGQEMLAVIKSWKNIGTDFPPEPRREYGSTGTLILVE